MKELPPLENAPLPAGIRCRFVDDVNGLRMHVLEAGFEGEGRPCVLLLHGFPELAYSWRKVMVPLAAAGLWTHHGLGCRLRRRACSVSAAQPGPGCAGTRCGAGLPRRGGGRWPRLRRSGRGLVRAGAARRVPLRCADERAVRGPACSTLRHGATESGERRRNG